MPGLETVLLCLALCGGQQETTHAVTLALPTTDALSLDGSQNVVTVRSQGDGGCRCQCCEGKSAAKGKRQAIVVTRDGDRSEKAEGKRSDRPRVIRLEGGADGQVFTLDGGKLRALDGKSFKTIRPLDLKSLPNDRVITLPHDLKVDGTSPRIKLDLPRLQIDRKNGGVKVFRLDRNDGNGIIELKSDEDGTVRPKVKVKRVHGSESILI